MSKRGAHPPQVGDLRFDPDSRQVTRGDRVIALTGRESRLLEYLMQNEGRVVTKTMVLAPIHTFHLGLWFNSPVDAANAGCPGTVTRFNGDHNAGGPRSALGTSQISRG